MVNLSAISAATKVRDDSQAANEHGRQPSPESKCNIRNKRCRRCTDHGCSNQCVDAPDEQPRANQQHEADEGDDEDELDEVGHSILSK